MTQQAYEKINSERKIYDENDSFPSSSLNLCKGIKLGDIYHIYIMYFCFFFTHIFNSNIKILFIVETVHDIGPIELFYLCTLSYICLKNIVLSIFTPRPRRCVQQRIILISSSDYIVTATRQFLFVKIHSKSCRVF